MDRIKQLILAFLREEIDLQGQVELEEWAAMSPENRALLAELQDPAVVAEALAKLDRLRREEAWRRYAAHAAASKRPVAEGIGRDAGGRVRRIVIRWSAAAVFAGLLGIGLLWLFKPKDHPVVSTPAVVKTIDVAAPARNRAMLTLASGQRVDLDSAATGALAQEGGAKIVKKGNGQLAYSANAGHPAEMEWNTLSNPRGSQVVNVTMSDGSRVWLNAESSVTYPTIFEGSGREVEVKGEAYFEVAPGAGRPFRVKRGQTVVEVLGTEFNLDAYDNEPDMRVTLVTGKVRVENGRALILSPGEQAIITPGQVALAQSVDLEAVLAWRNGRFAFEGADLPTVMRELGRWYDVQVSYEGVIPERRFGGKIGKSLTLDQVLKLLSKEKINYTIGPDHHLIVRP